MIKKYYDQDCNLGMLDGKTVAIIGGGPSGLSAAYYLQQMGHQCTIFEQRKELGGMLYYGIPNYRLPKDRLAEVKEEMELIKSALGRYESI